MRSVTLSVSLISAIATVCTPLLASDQFVIGQFADYAVLKSTGDHKTLSGNCDGKDVDISGSNIVARLHGQCQTFIIKGNHNRVFIDTANDVTVMGDGNSLMWKTTPGSVSSFGDDNVLKAK